MAKDDNNEYILSELKDLSTKTGNIEVTLAQQKTSFDAHTKQDENMYEELKRMNNILSDNTESLRDHMQQTALLKDTVIKMDARLYPIELERIRKEAVSEWRKSALILTAKVISFLVGGSSIIVIVKEVLSHFHW